MPILTIIYDYSILSESPPPSTSQNQISGSILGCFSPVKGLSIMVLGLETPIFMVFFIFTLKNIVKGYESWFSNGVAGNINIPRI